MSNGVFHDVIQWYDVTVHFLFLGNIWLKAISHQQGFWYFAEKKAKFRGIFRDKFAEKSADFTGKKSNFAEKSANFTGFSREKSQNLQKNRPISRDFSGKKSTFKGFSGANSKKNWPISREISTTVRSRNEQMLKLLTLWLVPNFSQH